MLTSFLAFDSRLTQRIRLDRRRAGWWSLAVLLAHSGDSWLWMGGLVLIWLLGDSAWHFRAALLAISVCIQALAVFALKQVIRRRRPAGEWGGIYRSIDPHSFPSGHATRAALLAVMAIGLGPGWFAAALLVWAPLVSLARVATGVHYFSDVLAGTLIGLLMGLGMLALQAPLMQLFPFLF